MPRAVILTALPVEYLAVRTHLEELQEEMHPQGTIYERGKFTANGREWEVGIAEVGAGNAGAAVEAERAIGYFKPNILFFVGIAGGIKDDVTIGDVVVATDVYGYESGKVTQERFSTRPKAGKSAYALVQRAKSEARKGEWLQRIPNPPTSPPRAFVAPIAAGEKVIASRESEIFHFLRASYNDAVAVEMEGFGFLSAAFAYPEIQAIAIRGISDLIEGKNDDSIEPEKMRQEKASHHASAFAFEILAKYKEGKIPTPDPNRKNLLDKVQDEVLYRLEASLHNAVSINLTKEKQPHQVQRPWDVEIKVGFQPNELLPPDEKLIDFFDRERISGRFIILGKPGAGKTTTLLELTRELLVRARKNINFPIPILLNLSSFREKDKQVISQWILNEIKDKYKAHPNLVKKWISNHQLLPLLDGLDELESSEHQERCVRAINEFLTSEDCPRYLVVCSRLEEYQDYKTRLQLNGAIYLRPLTDLQIRDYLVARCNTNILEMMNGDFQFMELMRTPLLLSITALVYRKISLVRWQSLNSFEERSGYLFKQYVDFMLKREIHSKAYFNDKFPLAKDIKSWLHNLTLQLNKTATTEFSIERMQPILLGKFYRILYAFEVGTVFACIGGCIVGFTIYLNALQFVSGISSLFIGIGVGLFFGFFLVFGQPSPLVVWKISIQ